MTAKRILFWSRLLSIGLYLPCLALEGVCTTGECGLGALQLFFGFFGFFAAPANLSWLANPALFIAWANAMEQDWKVGMVGAIAAPIFAILPLLMTEIVINEGGVATRITGFGLGYWFWLASTIVALIGYLWLLLERRKAD